MVDYKNIKFKNIAVVSDADGYDYVIKNILPLYSNYWIFQTDSISSTDEKNMLLKQSLENDASANVIIFGIQNYSKVKIKSTRILVLDFFIKYGASLNVDGHKLLALSIQSFINQWNSIDRIPGTKNWLNEEWSKEGGIYKLLY